MGWFLGQQTLPIVRFCFPDLCTKDLCRIVLHDPLGVGGNSLVGSERPYHPKFVKHLVLQDETELLEAAGRYGVATGIAFQIRDDIFDFRDDAAIGKPVGIDLKEQKITLPLLGALKGVADEAPYREMVRQIPERPENCEKLRRFVLENGGVEYASGRLEDYINEALAALEVFPPSEERDILAELARYNAIRRK